MLVAFHDIIVGTPGCCCNMSLRSCACSASVPPQVGRDEAGQQRGQVGGDGAEPLQDAAASRPSHAHDYLGEARQVSAGQVGGGGGLDSTSSW